MGTPSPAPRPTNPKSTEQTSHAGIILFAVTFIISVSLVLTLVLHPSAEQPDPEDGTASTAVPTLPTLPLTYPKTRKVDAPDMFFGVKVNDPYRWLEDGKSPEVQNWLNAQNKVARSYLDALPGRAALAKRFHELFYIDTISAPERAGDRYFYMKRKATQEKAALYWRDVSDAQEHVLIDPNQFITTDNAALGETAATLDGKLLAYTLRPNNADEATLYVKDVATGKDLPGEVIEGAKYASPSWMPDGSGFVYTYLPPADPAHPEDRPGLAVVRYHKLGTDPKNDPIIHAKTGDATKFINAYISRDGKWIFFVQQNGWDKNDLYYQPLKGQPTAAMADNWEAIVEGKNYLYSLYPWQGQAYILTNEDASRYRLFKVSLDNPHRSKWKEIIRESPTVVLQGVEIVGNKLVLDELENVTSVAEIRDLDGKPIRQIHFPALGTAGLSGDPDHDELFYSFANFTQPTEIFQTSVTNPAQTLWAKLNVPVDPLPYVVEQKFYPSKDGTRIPMFIVHRRDILLDGSTPFLLTGYGGFGISESPFFWPGPYPWLEAGGGFAVMNLRGGGEFGEQWHQDGMLLKKQNVFDDCIGAAEFLINQGYTKPEKLAIRGGSNGGLLVGAVMTQRPDLFRAVICEGPLLDMIRFDKFASGKTWTTEYGSPKDPEQFKALYGYSPYHHVKSGTQYPSVLFCTGADDDRVDPMHARKMAAELQAATGSANPILLRVESQSGHTGGDQVKKNIELGTDIWSFLVHELGAQVPGSVANQDTSN